MTSTDQNAVTFPPGVDGRLVLRKLRHPAWSLPGHNGAAYRRAATRDSPTRFALTYLPHYLRQQETGVLAFSPLHLDLAHCAISWMPDGHGIRQPRRDAWVAPRGAAKSVWLYLILPLWAIAHGHREFFLSFAASAGQATGHLGNIRAEIDPRGEGNQLLLHDFPELLPAQRQGARNTHQTVTVSGATIAGRGMGENTLGIRQRTARPDLVIGDDLEPGGADYTEAARDKQLARLVNNILPMGTKSTVVQLSGTVTTYGSIMHDVVRHALGEKTAPWIAENGFESHYYPPIITNPDGTRRSMWPARWSLEELEAMEGTRTYELNFLNNPRLGFDGRGRALSAYWEESLFKYRPPWRPASRVLSIDTAVTKKVTSDYSAIVQVGCDPNGREVVVEWSAAGRISGNQIKGLIWQRARQYPETLHDVCLESNQGGELWEEILSPMPGNVRLHLKPVSKSKKSRTILALRRYEDGAVWHRRPLPELEEQLLKWPEVKNDDLIDAVSAGIYWYLKGRR